MEEMTTGLARIRETYEQRDNRAPYADWRKNIYHQRHALGALFNAQTRVAVAKALNRIDANLDVAQILDYGCGTGSWIRMLIDMGAKPSNIVGVDLSESRLSYAAQQTPGTSFARTGGQLPFKDDTFDLVIVSLVFSSVGDQGLHSSLAKELERITKPQGAFIWLDLDRKHGELHGFGKPDLIRLFPNRTPVCIDRLHPDYFRRYYRFGRILNMVYNLTRIACESTLYVLVRNAGESPEN